MNDEFNDSNEDSNEAEGINNGNRMSLRERHPRQVQMQNNDKRLRNKRDELKFLQNFNPEQSNRERRKLKRKSQVNLTNKNFPHTETGALRVNDLDLCDCLDVKCLGCFYECEACGSTKCGPACRCNRKYMYEKCIFDGKDSTVPNTFFNAKLP